MTRRTITNSARRAFSRCRRYYWFRYIQKLDPIFTAPPLSFGTLIHACLEDFYVNKSVLFDGIIDKWRADYLAEFHSVDSSVIEGEVDTTKIDKMAELARGMMRGYVAKRAGDLNDWEILAVEKPFRFPLHTICGKCNGNGCDACGGSGLGRKSPVWDQAGKLDLAMRHNGLVWVVENKTTTLTDRDQYENDLGLDTQPRSYVWAVKRMIEANGWGKLGGLLYNVLRKKEPANPHPLQCKSCKGSGNPSKKAQKEGHHDKCPACVGSGVSGISKKQGTDTTIEKYTQAIRQYPHLDVNDYEDVLAMLQSRGDRFFWRFYHHVGESDLNDWETETYQVCRDIATTDRYYRNPDACTVMGRRCAFRRICTDDDPIARRNFTVREEDHPELKAEEIDG